ncbi:polysaccharide pyruvyl transferase family protein [Agromyces neolithicus]|uniref:Polysaccharide pyruvyl transferase domain-containing protein n=1 Tax=Agromyces neolithicus TaxID=269420 RepID=A0ABN2LU06_9MICO
MHYAHPIRRRVRELRQLAAAAAQPATRSRGVAVETYWWAWQPNFGDDLTRWLLPNYGVVPMYREPSDARLVGVGSILDILPTGFDGAVWGSGLMNDHAYPLPRAQILAVRGHLTRERIAAPETVAVGDPGLLVRRRVQRPGVRWDVGLVPHGAHRSNAPFLALAEATGFSVRVIDVHRTAPRAVGEIAACATVLTTSLHGLITADAFGIPALWTTLEPPLGGGAFKFADYESVITPNASRYLEFDERMPLAEMLAHTAAAPQQTVEAACDALEAALTRLPDVLGGLPRFPLSMWRRTDDGR